MPSSGTAKYRQKQTRLMAKNFDYLLLLTVFALMAISLLTLANATAKAFTGDEQGLGQILSHLNTSELFRHLRSFGIGFAVMLVVLFFKYETYRKFTIWAYLAITVLLAVAAVTGLAVNGAQAWFKFDALGLNLQPSELAKVTLILMLAWYMDRLQTPITKVKDVAIIVAIMAVPFAMVILQNDLGTALTFIVILVFMMFAGGVGWKWLLGLAAGSVAAMPLLWMLLQPYQQNRIMVFLNPALDTTGAGYHVAQSKIAIGSGQLFGKGLFQAGAMTGSLDYVPFKTTDFIFSVAGETFGFIGCLLIIILYAFMIYRILRIAMRAKDRFGSLICIGVAAMLVFHIVENIGMTMGLMPVTGIPLPFLSYGGSNLLSNMIAIGLVLNVGMRRNQVGMFEKREKA